MCDPLRSPLPFLEEGVFRESKISCPRLISQTDDDETKSCDVGLFNG
jgi:hypothetical protein